MLLALHAAVLVLAVANPLHENFAHGSWSRGNFTQLSFSADCTYELKVGGSITLYGALPAGTASSSTSGTDPLLGPFDQLSLQSNGGKTLGFVRYLSAADSFVLSRQDATLQFPAFELYRNDTIKTVSWRQSASMVGGASGGAPRDWAAANGKHFIGPMFLTSHVLKDQQDLSPLAAATLPSLGISPLNYFDSNSLFVSPAEGKTKCSPKDEVCLLAGRALNPSIVPAGTSMEVLLLGRPGFTRATRAVGALLRRYHHSTRLRGPSINSLSYWSDNAAGYSWWSQPGNDLDEYGPIGELYLRLQQEYKVSQRL
jgi:hypothetical protein